jgi:hypothetical protein
VATAYNQYTIIGTFYVCAEFALPEVKVPVIRPVTASVPSPKKEHYRILRLSTTYKSMAEIRIVGAASISYNNSVGRRY